MTLCGWKIFSKNHKKKKNCSDDSKNVATNSLVDLKITINTKENKFHAEDEIVSVTSKETIEAETKRKSSNNIFPLRTKIFEKCLSKNVEDLEETAEIESLDRGNPRNKCALKPGHSLMDWIRLGSSGCDLTGTKGAITPVTHVELAKHCTQNDSWLAIRGKVYNVTHYLDFHPGGADELMKGVGKDATKIFEDIHAWVNYEQLLAKCYVGPLRNNVNIDIEPFKSTKSSAKSLSPNDSNSLFKAPTTFLSSGSGGSSSARTSPVKSANILMTDQPTISSCDKPEIIPRFDWIQKTSDITLIFYTKSFCNPGLIIDFVSDNELTIRILIANSIHFYNFKFTHSVNWPCNLRVSHETGKIEVQLMKTCPELWTSYGLMDRKKLNEIEDLSLEYEVEQRENITSDSFALKLKPKFGKHIQIFNPVGYHFSIAASINGEEIRRSYTPVPVTFAPFHCASGNIPLLIKSYTYGIFAKHITMLTANTEVENSLKLSQPKGNFSLNNLNEHYRFGLLAAGSGVTPILSVLEHLLIRVSNRIENIQLILFNKSEGDIWCRQELETIAKKDQRLEIRHILSDPELSWTGETGRISQDTLNPLTNTESCRHCTYFCACGPTPFNTLSEKFLMDAGINSQNMFFFQG